MELVKKDESRAEKFEEFWGNELDIVFNDIGEKYDTANDFASFGLWNWVRRKFVSRMDLPDNAKVLDVCAGTNAVGIDMLTKNPTIEVTAMDRSVGMQKAGGRRAAERGLTIKSIIGDVHTLPFPDNSFDVVSLEAATRHLEAVKVFKEIHRVLKPGGHFYHCDLIKSKNRVVAFMVYNYWRVMIPVISFVFFRTTRFLGRSKSMVQFTQYFIDAIAVFYTSDELTRMMEESGFSTVEAQTLTFGTVGVHKARK
jgi:demethylmenaquinone methyltransferase / 2-methoxy-6-polyprenyl-1,4-benzoquinol methylase